MIRGRRHGVLDAFPGILVVSPALEQQNAPCSDATSCSFTIFRQLYFWLESRPRCQASQHVQAELPDFAALDIGHASLRDAQRLGGLSLRQAALLQPVFQPPKQCRAHDKFIGPSFRKQIIEHAAAGRRYMTGPCSSCITFLAFMISPKLT